MPIVRIICFALLYISASLSFVDEYIPLTLYFFLPISFILSFYCGDNSIRRNKYIKILTFLYVWILITYYGSIDFGNAIRQLRQIMGSYILCVTLANLSYKRKNIPWLYGIFVMFFIGMVIYAYNNIYSIQFEFLNQRLEDDKMNANMISYYTFYVTFALFILGEFRYKYNNLNKIFKYLFWVTIPLTFYAALLSGSRQVFLIQGPLIIILLYIRYWRVGKLFNKFCFLVLLSVIFIFGYNYADNLYEQSFLKERYERNVKDDVRSKLLVDAFDVGIKNPIIGVGPGNYVRVSKYKLFSHCSYTEVFANNGIIGLILYTLLVFSLLKNQIDRYKKYKHSQYLVFLTFTIIFIIDNFFYVFYTQLWLMSFFILVASNSDGYYMYNDDKNTVGKQQIRLR